MVVRQIDALQGRALRKNKSKTTQKLFLEMHRGQAQVDEGPRGADRVDESKLRLAGETRNASPTQLSEMGTGTQGLEHVRIVKERSLALLLVLAIVVVVEVPNARKGFKRRRNGEQTSG
jgi:hypothetical protein